MTEKPLDPFFVQKLLKKATKKMDRQYDYEDAFIYRGAVDVCKKILKEMNRSDLID